MRPGCPRRDPAPPQEAVAGEAADGLWVLAASFFESFHRG